MKSKYVKDKHCFQEQSEMEKPYNFGLIKELIDNDCIEAISKQAISDYKYYTDHLSTLRTIPCRPDDQWEDGKEYIEGKDYKVQKCNCKIGDDCPFVNNKWMTPCNLVIPIIPPSRNEGTLAAPSEAELWKEVLTNVSNLLYAIDAETISEDTVISRLSDKYSISRREQAPDWQPTFLKEPVSFLLSNAIKHCTTEQLVALRDALIDRTPVISGDAIEFAKWITDNYEKDEQLGGWKKFPISSKRRWNFEQLYTIFLQHKNKKQ